MEKQKSKVLILIPSFTIGGTISSLSALLSSIDPLRVSVDVYSRSHLGPCRSQLTNCRILKERLWLSSVVRSRGPVLKFLSYGVQFAIRFCSYVGFNLSKYICRWGGRRIHSDQYDVVIAFQESIAQYVSYMPAKRRIAWIHCDYERLLHERPEIGNKSCFHYFDKIVCVSKAAKHSFESVFPEMKSKTVHIYNIVDYCRIREVAAKSKPANSDFVTDKKTIVSVGRFDEVKQFDKIPSISAKIKELTRIPFRWYIIGYVAGGKIEQKVVERIKEYQVENEVIVFPAQMEVLPYIAKADILVNTSRSETFSMVIFEARALNVIPVMNSISVAAEVIEDTKDGFICSLNEMPSVIAELLESDFALDIRPWNNQASINSFYNLIKG